MSAAIRSAAPRQSVRGGFGSSSRPSSLPLVHEPGADRADAADEQVLRELIEWVNRRLRDCVIRGKP